MPSDVIAAGLGYAIGWTALRPFIGITGLIFVICAALPAGAAIWVFCAAWFQSPPMPYTPGSASVIACAVAAGLNFKTRRAVKMHEIGAFVFGLCLIGVLAWGFSLVDVTTVGSDGFWSIYMANEIQLLGGFSVDTRFLLLSKEPLFQALIQSGAPALGKPYFTALQPLFGVTAIAVFAVLSYRSLHASGAAHATALALSLGAAAVVASTPIVIVYALTFKTHGVFMVFFLLAFAALYLAQVERSGTWFLLAMFFSAILIWVGLEAAVTVFPLLVAAVSASRIEFRLRALLTGSVAAVWAAWFLYLSIATAYSDHFERSHVFKAYLLVVLMLSAFAGLVFLAFRLARSASWQPWTEQIIDNLPKLMVATLLFGHIVFAIYSLEHSVGVLRNYGYTLYSFETGAIGAGVAFALMLMTMLRKESWADHLAPNSYAMIGTALILPFVFATEAVYAGDGTPMLSSARVLVQFYPAALFWLVIRLGTVLK